MTNARRRTDNWEHVDCFRQVTQNVKKVRWQAISSRQTQIPGNSKNYGKNHSSDKTKNWANMYFPGKCRKMANSSFREKQELDKHSTGKNNVANWTRGKKRNWTHTLLARTKTWTTGFTAETETTLYWQEQDGEQQLAARTGAGLTLYRQEQELGNHFSGKNRNLTSKDSWEEQDTAKIYI